MPNLRSGSPAGSSLADALAVTQGNMQRSFLVDSWRRVLCAGLDCVSQRACRFGPDASSGRSPFACLVNRVYGSGLINYWFFPYPAQLQPHQRDRLLARHLLYPVHREWPRSPPVHADP